MPGIIISLIFQQQLRLIFRATPSEEELTCPAEVFEYAANRFCFQIGATNFPRSTWGHLFALQ
jgi:hypothetical protein